MTTSAPPEPAIRGENGADSTTKLGNGEKKSEPTPEELGDDTSMSLWEHLAELRSRLVRMIIAFIGGGIVAWLYREQVLTVLTRPFVEAWVNSHPSTEPPSLSFPSPAAAFLAYVRLSAMSGLIFALPIILYQLWAFIAPGLYSKEKRLAIPFVVSSCALFVGGGWFGWKFAFPLAFQYLLQFDKPLPGLEIKPTIMISEYIEFVTHMLAAFGVAAELPMLVFFLSIAGIVTHKHLIKFFRYFVVVAFVIAAVLTPPDPMSQLMMAVPLCVLYGISIGIAFIFSRKRA